MEVDSTIKSILALGGTDFSIKATYKNRKSRYPIIGIFDEPYQGVNIAETEFSSSTPIFTIPTSTLPCRPEFGDTLVIDCEEYTVRNFKSDGTGITVLQLEFMTDLDRPELKNILLLQDGGNLLTEDGYYLVQETGNI